jgi:hypothetical protein
MRCFLGRDRTDEPVGVVGYYASNFAASAKSIAKRVPRYRLCQTRRQRRLFRKKAREEARAKSFRVPAAALAALAKSMADRVLHGKERRARGSLQLHLG